MKIDSLLLLVYQYSNLVLVLLLKYICYSWICTFTWTRKIFLLPLLLLNATSSLSITFSYISTQKSQTTFSFFTFVSWIYSLLLSDLIQSLALFPLHNTSREKQSADPFLSSTCDSKTTAVWKQKWNSTSLLDRVWTFIVQKQLHKISNLPSQDSRPIKKTKHFEKDQYNEQCTAKTSITDWFKWLQFRISV